MQEQLKTATEVAASGIAVGTFGAWLAGNLPPIAAACSIVWIVLQIYVMGKREGWWGRRK